MNIHRYKHIHFAGHHNSLNEIFLFSGSLHSKTTVLQSNYGFLGTSFNRTMFFSGSMVVVFFFWWNRKKCEMVTERLQKKRERGCHHMFIGRLMVDYGHFERLLFLLVANRGLFKRKSTWPKYSMNVLDGIDDDSNQKRKTKKKHSVSIQNVVREDLGFTNSYTVYCCRRPLDQWLKGQMSKKFDIRHLEMVIQKIITSICDNYKMAIITRLMKKQKKMKKKKSFRQ